MANELEKTRKSPSKEKKSSASKKRAKADLNPVSHDGVRTAFHHMQRASVVISLMEKGTGEDLRDLLARGVKLYEHVLDGKGDEATILRAIGLLRAAEHLALAGLYAARHKHRQKVEGPSSVWLENFMAGTTGRLKQVEGNPRAKGPNLFPVAEELVLQAEESNHDPHLAFELAMAADALCFALENGL